MARKRTSAPLGVLLNGRLVGHLNKRASGAIDFRYDPSWLEWEHAFPISFSMPLRDDSYRGAAAIAVFDNLLPDNDEIRRRLAANTVADGIDAYSLLRAIGRDCVGALQFIPEGMDPGEIGTIDGVALDGEAIARLVGELSQAPLGIRAASEFRISLAGAQDKTALLFHDGHWFLPRGATPTTHILKPQIGILNHGIDLSRSVENEYFCMKLLAALGFSVANTEILDFQGTRVLAVERFDRIRTRDGRLLRILIEDCCQALSIPSTRKYQSDGGPGISRLLEFFKASDRPSEDRARFLKAQIVFWLLGATDGHAKNFSVFLHAHGGFSRTPLYDAISVQPNLDARQLRFNQAKMAMSVGYNRHYVLNTIQPRHYEQTARTAGMPRATVHELMQDIAMRLPGAINGVTAELPADFPQAVRTSIVRGLEQRGRLMRASL